MPFAQDFVRLDQEYAEIHGRRPPCHFFGLFFGRGRRDSNQRYFVFSRPFLPSVVITERFVGI